MVDKTKVGKNPEFLDYPLVICFWHSIEKKMDLFQTVPNTVHCVKEQVKELDNFIATSCLALSGHFIISVIQMVTYHI